MEDHDVARLGEAMFVEFRRLARTGMLHERFWTGLARFAVDWIDRRRANDGSADPIGTTRVPADHLE